MPTAPRPSSAVRRAAALLLLVAAAAACDREPPPIRDDEFVELPGSQVVPDSVRPAPSPGDTALVGRCAYEPDGDRNLGEILDVGPPGYLGDPGQRQMTVLHPLLGRREIPYPRRARVADCVWE